MATETEIAILVNKINPYIERIKNAEAKTPPKTPPTKPNPFLETSEKVNKDIALDKELHEFLLRSLNKEKTKYQDFDQLLDVLVEVRGRTLVNAVERLQMTTNDYLVRFFDSEILVNFEIDGDALITKIFKNGHECNFKQLSKGQRGLLKLTFAASVMKEASNNSGTHFDTIFLDESVDGLDADLKVKAYNLFSELELDHTTVMVIDHSLELKSLFNNEYEVTLTEEGSCINVKS
jgi:DNA repair exonuclease SbcCD ATPase subunit